MLVAKELRKGSSAARLDKAYAVARSVKNILIKAFSEMNGKGQRDVWMMNDGRSECEFHGVALLAC